MKTKKINFLTLLLMLGIVPVLVALVFSTIASVNKLTDSLEKGVFDKLEVAATDLASYYEYDIKAGTIKYEEDYVDSLKSKDVELTVFKDDTRFMTSIYKDGTTDRNIGTTADATIYADVKAGNKVEKSGVTIGGQKYYVVYLPMYDADHNFWGMSFSGTPETEVRASISSARNTLIIIAIIIILICCALITLIALKLKTPMVKAVDSLNIIAKGNIQESTDTSSIINEINGILNATNELQKALQSSIGSVKESTQALTSAVSDVDEKTGANVDSISQINVAINEVSETSQQVAQNAQMLSNKAIELGNNVEEITENVKILTQASNDISNANKDASNYMNSVYDSSNESVEAVKEIHKVIGETNEAISEITKALDILEKIADDTKLLSLNASIEAAHAGESGKGFAVVAGNIKELADDSSVNVEKIAEIINKITKLSEKSVLSAEKVLEIINTEQKYVIDTQEKFVILSNSVDASVTEIESISNKTEVLANIERELTSATTDLGAISEELGASAEEVSASCQVVAEACTDTQARTEEMSAINSSLTEAVDYFN